MQLQVTNSPFTQEQAELLNRLLPTLTEAQRIWLSGYLAALPAASSGTRPEAAAGALAGAGVPGAAQGSAPAVAPATGGMAGPVVPAGGAPAADAPVAVLPAPSAGTNVAPAATEPREATVLFGSQTGNSQRLAKQFAGKLEARGYRVTLAAMNEFRPNELKKARNLFIVVSTHGEGDPPDNAVSFHEFLHSKRAPKLDGLRFSVLALGDTSYEHFCKTGKDFDKRLEELGGWRLAPRVDCDVDFEEAAAGWMEAVLRALDEAVAGGTAPEAVPAAVAAPAVGAPTGAGLAAGPVAAAEALAPAPFAGTSGAAAGTAVAVAERPAVAVAGAAPATAEPVWSRTNPFPAEVLENLNLNGRGSKRETRHLELSLAGSGLHYEPGDCLAVIPENHPGLVDELIREAGWNAEEPVPVGRNGDTLPLRDALLRHCEITVLTRPLLEQAAQRLAVKGLGDLLKPGREAELKAYLQGRDLLDLVRDFGLRGVPAGELVSLLRRMPARQYSIASSLKAFPDEAHLTVRVVRYHAHGRDRYGVCSTWLAERVRPGDTVPVYVHHNPNFKLPADPDTPIIMIGPGTGVAPFRAFLQEREETGARGKSWLFFGDHHFLTDFLYQTEWQRWLKDGVLTRMDVAFSRDTDRKVYVQHRMLEHARELCRWLEEGACVYVCGDEKKMAPDVHAALVTVLEREGGMSGEEARAYLADMQRQKRYQRDVY